MLKKFFISMLGTMAGLWLSLLILVFGSIFAVGILISKSAVSSVKSGDAILYIDLTGTISDRPASVSMSDILSLMDESADDLESILGAISRAADDKDIKGIYINCGGSELGIASRGEVIQQLQAFRKKGKWVYAYADNFSQGDYYIASAADKVFVNPVGMLDVHGVGSMVMFYKDVLNKLGIDIDVVRVGSYKSAVEPYLRMDMSPESRLQTEVYVNQIWGEMCKTIANNRGISNPDSISLWADSLIMTWAPERYVDVKAVSQLSYRNEVEDMLRTLMDIDKDKDLPLITPSEYMEVKSVESLAKASEDHIAVLYAVGDIVDTGEGGIVGETMVPQIYELAKDDHVKGLVLRVNSPGGSAFASEQIWHALEDFKATGKPFYVSMGDYAASGGYYISCGADMIYSDPTTLTGSIGIFGVIPNAERLLKDKIGLGFATVQTSDNATFPSIYTAPTADQIAGMQRYVERGYDTFTSRVAQGRDISVDSVKAIGGGRVWDGMSALNIGLVDKLGTLADCQKAIAEKLGMDASDFVSYPKNEASLFQELLRKSSKSIEISIDGIPAEDVMKCYRIIGRVNNIDPLQMRMETVILK